MSKKRLPEDPEQISRLAGIPTGILQNLVEQFSKDVEQGLAATEAAKRVTHADLEWTTGPHPPRNRRVSVLYKNWYN